MNARTNVSCTSSSDLFALAGTRGETRERLGVPFHDLGGRALVSTFPPFDEREIHRPIVHAGCDFHSVTN